MKKKNKKFYDITTAGIKLGEKIGQAEKKTHIISGTVLFFKSTIVIAIILIVGLIAMALMIEESIYNEKERMQEEARKGRTMSNEPETYYYGKY